MNRTRCRSRRCGRRSVCGIRSGRRSRGWGHRRRGGTRTGSPLVPRRGFRGLGFAFLADHLAQPAADFRAIHVVVVHPALVAGVVGGIDIDALHLPAGARQQGLERVQVVALDDEVAAPRIARGKLGNRFEQAKWNVLVMFDDGGLADPVEGGHGVCCQGCGVITAFLSLASRSYE